MTEIPLTTGGVALVDDADAERVLQWSWYGGTEGLPNGAKRTYAKRTAKPSVRMHRFILSAAPGTRVDHKDGNGLNNQRWNIRFCTPRQNAQNRARQSNNGSGVPGVWWISALNRWEAGIRVNGHNKYLGYFTDFQAAVASRKAAEVLYFGDFRRVP